ncbi:pilus assembly protein PilP [Oceanimonas sp. MB9]|uniref:pilus assembly protein PilP n=1 Tax=Oceanimonas sp. MB9 TaxID=2588453 RepID=UPI0013F63D46|nr:pilus assembly protein PilP [Oceanimonas sp. MB9]NHH99907.1 hypothetical protein [Oceanimonas sp. MB9]
MNRVLLLSLLLMLTACSEQDDLRQYVAQVRSRPAVPPEPVPEVNQYVPEDYRPDERRSPFVSPKPEGVVQEKQGPVNCEQPNLQRAREPLEQYSLSNLYLRGTLQNAGGIKALISAQDGETHIIDIGHHMGLNHGRVIRIERDGVTLQEFVPDGRGCWNKRETALELAQGQP